MTTQATTLIREQGRHGLRSLVGMTAATLAVLGGVVLWQVQAGGHEAAPSTSATVGTIGEGATPQGGLAELYRDRAREAMGIWAQPAFVPEPESTLNASYLPAATAIAPTSDTMSGMAELYGEQAREAALRQDDAGPQG